MLRPLITFFLAVLTIVVTALPGAAATTTRPLPQQWWFSAWFIDTKLWKYSKGQGVTVAVLDTGVQADISELSGAVLPGADFEGGGGDGRTDQDTKETGGHGTGIASLIASRGGASGFLGVAPEAKILPIVAREASSHAKGIRLAADRGAKVVNISQGAAGPCPLEVQEAIRYAIERDVIIVAAAGNSGDESNNSEYPANCEGVIAVGAADAQGNLWRSTQRQPYVDIAAPGVSGAAILKDGSLQQSISGTSIAAALTSGAIALVRSKYPNLNNREVVRRVVASARDIGPPGKDELSGHGLIRPYRIFEGLIPKDPPNPVFEEYDKWLATQPKSTPQAGSGAGGSDSAAGGQPSGGSGGGDVDWITVGVFGGLLGGALLISGIAYFRNRSKRMAMAAPYGQHPPYGPPPGPGQPMAGPPPSMGAPMPPQQHGAPPQGGGGPHFMPPGPPSQGPPPGGTGPQQGPLPPRR